MNRKIPYDKILADKMEHLPVPDMEASWQKMRSILDNEMPVAEKKRPAAGKWWLGAVAALLISGALLWYTHTEKQADIHPPAALIESTIRFPETAPGKNINKTDRTQDADDSRSTPVSTAEKAVEAGSPGIIRKKTAEAHLNSDKNVYITEAPGTGPVGKNLPANKPAADPRVYTEPIPEKKLHAAVSNLHSSEISENAIPNDKTSFFSRSESATVIHATPASVPVENLLYTDSKNISAGSYIGRLAYTLPESEAVRKAALRQLKRQQRKDERDMARSYSTSRSLWGEQPDRWFAAGVAPFQNVAVGNQKTYNYGAGATRSMVTDYIPAPYLQLHVTNRVYVQSEFQFNAPQSTPALLLDQRNAVAPMSPGILYENTYLRKLYYFNIPVSFYYSPVKNFYLGSGVQFSSLSSGLATVEQMGANNTQLASETITLKDDALSSNLRGSEWRYLLDATYYINRFSFGLRYSQALNNYIDLKINNSLPPSQARNQAIQLSMRYNIIVSDKRR